MKTALRWAALLAALGLASSVAADLETAIDALAQRELEAGNAVGLTIGVARGDEPWFVNGYGLADVENDVPATAETVYRVGSITKMFTAAAILLLVEDGEVSLGDPLTRFLPEFPAPKVTVRQLLNHTSGIVNFPELPDYRAKIRDDVTHEEILARFQDLPLQFEPGARYRYSNSGYYLLGMIVEIASEMTFEAFLKERVFGPLKLDATLCDRTAKIVPHRARGYANWGGKISNAPFNSMTQPFAAGALASTAGDLLRWNRALVENQLLAENSREAMIERGKLTNGQRTAYGLGCFIRKMSGETVIGHAGSIVGFGGYLGWLPDRQLTVVVLGNSGRFPAQKIAERVVALALAEESR